MKFIIYTIIFIFLIFPAFSNEDYAARIFAITVIGILLFISNIIYEKIPKDFQEKDIAFRKKIKSIVFSKFWETNKNTTPEIGKTNRQKEVRSENSLNCPIKNTILYIASILFTIIVLIVVYKLYIEYNINDTYDAAITLCEKSYLQKNRNIENILKKAEDNVKYRYINTPLPENYLADEQTPNSELINSIRYDLFNLYRFQKLDEQQRVKEFEDQDQMYTISDQIVGFVDPKQVYKIAENYCVLRKFNGDYYQLEKVLCENPKDILELPFERCEWFKNNDKNGTYYNKYDLESLWNEFNAKGINKINKEIDKEINEYQQNKKILN